MPPLSDPPPAGAPRDLAELPGDRPLTVPLLVRGSLDNLLFILLVGASVVLFGVGLAELLRRPPRWDRVRTCIDLGFAAAVPAALVWLYLMRRRQWLEVT